MGEIRAGGRNNVVLAGRDDKPVVMLANGFGCDQNMWRLIAPGLAGDYRVVLHVKAQIPGSTLGSLLATGHCLHLRAPEVTLTAIRSFAAADGGEQHG